MSFVGAIVGARRSGKTSLALDLLLSVWRYRFDMIVIMSRTITLQEDVWRRLAGTGVLIIEKLDMPLLEKLQNFMASTGKEALLICDDIGRIANYWARRIMAKGGVEDELTYLAYASRHYGISLLYLSQDVIQMAPGYRKNFDFVICLEASITDQQILYTELLSNTCFGYGGAYSNSAGNNGMKGFREYYMANTGSFRFFQIYKEDGFYKVWPLPLTSKQEKASNASYPSYGHNATIVGSTNNGSSSNNIGFGGIGSANDANRDFGGAEASDENII